MALDQSYRIENLNAPYRSPDQREDAMIGRWGHVTDRRMRPGVLQVYVDAGTPRRLAAILGKLHGIIAVRQLGDTEAVGTIPAAHLKAVARALRLYRVGQPRGRRLGAVAAVRGVSRAPDDDRQPGRPKIAPGRKTGLKVAKTAQRQRRHQPERKVKIETEARDGSVVASSRKEAPSVRTDR